MKNLLKGIILSALSASLVPVLAQSQNSDQNFCGTLVPPSQWEQEMGNLVREYTKSQTAGKSTSQVFTIPVIMHVIHGGQAVGTYPNLAQGQLVSQIQTLNSDYGGVGYNSWNYPSAAFTNWATGSNILSASLDALGRIAIANCNVQFCLATKDTAGNVLAEPGIERINYISRGWQNPTSVTGITTFQNYVNNTIKPATIWNVTKYLNIWITDENINATGGLLGYATFPPFSTLSGIPSVGTSTSDGFWCYAKAFGSATYYPSGTYYTGYDRGRTSTHEIGHWLGLRHIWGDANCATDYCNDTPPAAASNANAPSYPYHVGTCTNNSPDGEMYMNFMDYTNDNAKYMYTPDQASRIQTAMTFSPYRKFLGTHNLCTVAAIAPTASFNIAPNACGNAVVTLSNMTNGTPIPSYTWSASGPGAATFNPNINSALSVSFNTPGTYTVTLAASNGTLSSFSKVITIGVTPNLVITPNATIVCTNDIITLNGSGGNSYAWQPGAQIGQSVTYTGLASQVYTCVATGSGNCKTTGTVSIDVQECTGIDKLNPAESVFALYPNPVKDHLQIKLLSGNEKNVLIEVMDALGNTILTQNNQFRKDKSEIYLDVADLAAGIYMVKISVAGNRAQRLKVIKN